MDNETGSNWPRSVIRGISYAAKMAIRSDSPTYRIGAVLAKNGRIVRTGFNAYRKTCPGTTTRYNTIHAEFACLKGLTKDEIAGCTLYIARRTNGNQLAMAKPCDACFRLILQLNPKRVYYTDRCGGVIELER